MKLFDYKIATETIDHQLNNQDFKNDLIDTIQKLLDKIDSGIYVNRLEASSDCIEHTKIRNIILKRTGVLIKFIPLKGIEAVYFKNNAAIRPFKVTIFQTLENLDLKKTILTYLSKKNLKETIDYFQPAIKALKKEEGTIDTKTGRLGGAYSKIENDCAIDFYGLYKNLKMTAREIAGILMHEIGHVFTWTQFSNKFVMVNQALHHIHSSKATLDSDKLFQLAYSELKEVDRDITEQEIKNMISGNTISSTYNSYMFLLKNFDISGLLLDLNGSNVNTNSETIADMYSVRMGFGLEFITGTDKINKNFIRKHFYMSSVLCVILIAVLVTAALLPNVSIYGILSLLVMYVTTGITIVENNIYKEQGLMIYKYDKERMQKAYNQLVDSIKDLGLSGIDKQYTIDSLKNIKLIIDSLPSDISMLDRISHILSSKARMARAYSIQQDVLEKIASNDLFVKAVELQLTSEGKM